MKEHLKNSSPGPWVGKGYGVKAAVFDVNDSLVAEAVFPIVTPEEGSDEEQAANLALLAGAWEMAGEIEAAYALINEISGRSAKGGGLNGHALREIGKKHCKVINRAASSLRKTQKEGEP